MDQLPEEIRRLASELDNAIEANDLERVVQCFSDDCEIHMFDVRLIGKQGVERWLRWLYRHVRHVRLLPVTIMIEKDVFIEEFVVDAQLHDGTRVRSKQAEVLVYRNYKVTSLRLYFDRLDFARAAAKGFLAQAVVRRLAGEFMKGL